MTKIRARRICGTSLDVGMIDIRKEKSLSQLDACLHYEIRHMRRKTMIKNLKSRIRKLEKAAVRRERI